MDDALHNKKIYKYEPVSWKSCQWLQPKKFKSRLRSDIEKLKKSLLENDFIMPFFVSEKIQKDKIYILDGHGRKEALEELEQEGYRIPDCLPALFLDVDTKQKALQLLLLYNSSYGLIRKSELDNLLSELNMKDNEQESPINLSNVLDDLVVDEYQEQDDEQASENKADVLLSFGVFRVRMYRFMVKRNVFDDWLTEVKSKVGLKDQDIIQEFKRRLGILEYEQKAQALPLSAQAAQALTAQALTAQAVHENT